MQIGGNLLIDINNTGGPISLSSDGNIIAIGPANGGNRVKVFKNINDEWVQLGQDLSPERPSPIFINEYDSMFGYSLDLSTDGEILAVGAPEFYSTFEGSIHPSSVVVYRLVNNTWVQIGENIYSSSSTIYDHFGESVSLSSDGAKIAISAPGANDHVMIFENINDIWTLIGDPIINGGGSFNSAFGNEVELSYNGELVIISNPNVDVDGIDRSGQLEIFQYINNEWQQIVSSLNGDDIRERFSDNISLSADAQTLAVNSTYLFDDPLGDKIQIYKLENQLSINEIITINFKFYPNPTKNQFTIKLENSTELQNVTIYNNLGQQVLTSKKSIINTSKLASGLYVVEIETNRGKSAKKLIIE